MSTVINARSPYYIKFSYPSGSQPIVDVQMSVAIYTGDKNQTLSASSYQYTLKKKPNTSVIGNQVVFEISELIRDYLKTNYFTTAVDAVWVNTEAIVNFTSQSSLVDVDYLAIDGFGYYPEGINPRTTSTPMVLQSNKTVYFVPGRDIRIPVFSENTPTIGTSISSVWDLVDEFWDVEDANWEATTNDQVVVDSDISSQKIQYINIDSTNAVDGDTITFTGADGTVETITLRVICERRGYDAYRAVYYNKFGALQSFWVTQRSSITTKAKSENYRANIVDLDTLTYNTTDHSRKRFNVNAVQSIQVNTPLIDEAQNDALEELILSEQCWLEKDASTVFPVVVKSESVERKTKLNDKLIQYTLDFDFAYSTINDLR